MAHIPVGLPSTRQDLQRARTACSAAATGPPQTTATPGSAGQRNAASASRAARATRPSVSGFCWLLVSLERNGLEQAGCVQDGRSLLAEEPENQPGSRHRLREST